MSLLSWLPSLLSVLALMITIYLQQADRSDAAPPSLARRPLHGLSCPGRAVPTGDLYAVLGVMQGTEGGSLKAAYKRLALAWHPDKQRGDCPAAEAVFAEVSRAYTVLSQPELRDVYDRLGDEGLQRLQDGDPSVAKGWLPPDEVLRRHGFSEEKLVRRWDSLDDVVTNVFAWLEGR